MVPFLINTSVFSYIATVQLSTSLNLTLMWYFNIIYFPCFVYGMLHIPTMTINCPFLACLFISASTESSLGSSIEFSCHVFLLSFDLEHFCSISLCFMTLAFLKNTVFSILCFKRSIMSLTVFVWFSLMVIFRIYIFQARIPHRWYYVLLRESHMKADNIHLPLHWSY